MVTTAPKHYNTRPAILVLFSQEQVDDKKTPY